MLDPNHLFDTSVLKRSPAYYDGLKYRLGFEVQDGQAVLIHVAGVTAEGRQGLLKKIDALCAYDRAPVAKLEPEPNNPYDRFAIRVLVATSYDSTTSESEYSCAGYIPKGRCPYCATTLSGKRASSQVCPTCEAEIGFTSPVAPLKSINSYLLGLMHKGTKLLVGVDSVTKGLVGSMGLDIWIRREI